MWGWGPHEVVLCGPFWVYRKYCQVAILKITCDSSDHEVTPWALNQMSLEAIWGSSAAFDSFLPRKGRKSPKPWQKNLTSEQRWIIDVRCSQDSRCFSFLKKEESLIIHPAPTSSAIGGLDFRHLLTGEPLQQSGKEAAPILAKRDPQQWTMLLLNNSWFLVTSSKERIEAVPHPSNLQVLSQMTSS